MINSKNSGEEKAVIRFFQKISAKLHPQPTQSKLQRETSKVEESDLTSCDAIIIPSLKVGFAQSIGKQREHNEDSLFVFNTAIICNNTILPLGIFIVADGMGGHQYGEIASSVAIQTLAKGLIKKIYIPFLSSSVLPDQKATEVIFRETVGEANREIMHYAPGGGTTLTALLILGSRMTIAHVGDSRSYIIGENGSTKLITRDHSLVNRLVELGQITDNEAAIHPQRNVLYRALGQGELFEPDISTISLPNSVYLLLCSDGLWGTVPEAEMITTILSQKDLQLKCNSLIDAANDAGGGDNISLILIKFSGE